MTSAAKEAQWGDQEQSDGASVGFHAPGPSFFEDGSDASSDSGEMDLDDKDIYESNLGDSRRPLLEDGLPLRLETPGTHSSDKKATEALGPSSDSLTPCVNVTRQHDRLALSSQRIELAMEWRLGTLFSSSVDVVGEIDSMRAGAKVDSIPQHAELKRGGGKCANAFPFRLPLCGTQLTFFPTE
jgi:hypothetical protein